MNITYAGWSLLNPKGGGEISALFLMKKLARDHNINSIGIGGNGKKLKKKGIDFFEYEVPFYINEGFMPYHLYRFLLEMYFEKKLTQKIKDIEPDLLVLQSPSRVSSLHKKNTFKTIVFVRALSAYGIESKEAKKIKHSYNLPILFAKRKRNKNFLEDADLVITNSNFMKNKLKEKIGIDSKVVYPFIDCSEYEFEGDIQEKSGEYVTFSTLKKGKGGEIVLKIAEKLPEKKFLILKGKKPNKKLVKKSKRLGNVKIKDWVEDMGKIYKKTKVLLMPSVWEEPFGRLPIEAGVNGIPTIGSNRGGLPESIGKGGIVVEDVWDIEKWVECIKKFDDDEYYKEMQKKAIKNAKKKNATNMVKKFKNIVEREFKISL